MYYDGHGHFYYKNGEKVFLPEEYDDFPNVPLLGILYNNKKRFQDYNSLLNSSNSLSLNRVLFYAFDTPALPTYTLSDRLKFIDRINKQSTKIRSIVHYRCTSKK